MTLPDLPFDLYPWFAIGSSILCLLLFGWHARHSIARYHRVYREDLGSSSDLLIALTLVVVSVGLVVAAIGQFLPEQIAGNAYRIAGLSIVRGAMVLCGVSLFLSDRRV